jgi:pectin methylesterase-like acyl-CoA thioesterase
MKRYLSLLLAVTACAAQAQDARTVTEPVVPPSCAVLPAGADVPARDDTARIQQAIDQCAPGRAVVLAASNERTGFTTGPLVLRTGVTLVIDAGATLYAKTDPKAYDRGEGTCGTIDQSGRGCRPLIHAPETRGSGIMGRGTIDGQGGHAIDGQSESWWQLARRAQREKGSQNVPRLIVAERSTEFTLYGITLRNSPNFHVVADRVDGFTAWGVTLDTPADARNTDGIDPISSRNVTITKSVMRTGDDSIAIKGGSRGPTENVSVLDNRFYAGHGMSIGSETNAGVRRVLVDTLSMQGATSGLRIKSDVSRGGLVEQVVYRNVCLRDVKAPIDLDTNYTKGATGSLIPQYRGIVFERVHALTGGKVVLRGLDAAHPLQVAMRDVVVDGDVTFDTQHAGLAPGASPLGGTALDCSGRFAPFPSAPVADKRPQLSAAQAAGYALAEVMRYATVDGKEAEAAWNPLADPLATGAGFRPDYVVDASAPADGVRRFASVQAAVNRAVIDGRGARKARLYILLRPGTYRELLYVPATAVPLTLYGEGDPAATRITAVLDAAVASAEYERRFGAQFAGLDPSIRAMYESVRERPAVSTGGAMTVWVRGDGFQARNLTFENGYNKDTGNAREECGERACGSQGVNAQMNIVHHQAVALQVEGADRVQFENVRLLGFQDTLYMNTGGGKRIARIYFRNSYVEGDVDYIFGDATAYFEDCEIRSLGDRSTSYVAAPDTNWRARYGFVFNRCRFTSDGKGYARNGNFYLARQWFHNQRCTPYGSVPVPAYACRLGEANGYTAPAGTITRATLETVGKMVVLNSRIGAHIHKANPWADWNRNGTLPYRPVQFDSDGYLRNLRDAGLDPVRDLGYTAAPRPAAIFLGEFNNIQE